MQMPNTENLEIVADAIEASNTFDQKNYMHVCGSPACIAGHTVVLLDPGFIEFCNPKLRSNFNRSTYSTTRDGIKRELRISIEASKLLGLTEFGPGLLFDAYPMGGVFVTNKHAAKVLRNIAETGKVDWNIE